MVRSKVATCEIGVIYKRGSRLYLGITSSTLITGKNKKISVVRLKNDHTMMRSATVEDLCINWGLNLEEFDRATGNYLKPDAESARPRPRGSGRRSQAAEEDYWKSSRISKIAGFNP